MTVGERPAIAVIEDDPSIGDLVQLYLQRDGYRVLRREEGEAALELLTGEVPRLVVLDVALRGHLDGFEVCRRLRQDRRTAGLPVILLTARDDEVDRITGLELGADDYVTKPFSPRELMARVRAVLRRSASPSATGDPLLAGDVEIDEDRREARVGDRPVHLASREFDLLVHLARHPGRALTRRQLLDGAWGSGWVGDERTVDVHVRQLRRKLGAALPIATVRGTGYRLG